MIQLQAAENFFHARTGQGGLQLAGWIRIGYASLFLMDRLLLGLDIEYLLSPTNGAVPYNVARQDDRFHSYHWTLFHWMPKSDNFLWCMYWLGLIHGILLLLGVMPRLQALGILVNLVSFHHHNELLWDGQDIMFRVWCFFLMFLPLHRVTVYDLFRKPDTTRDSWPMWPFRLWQIEIILVAIGVVLGKLDGPAWLDGTALYLLGHKKDLFPGVFNPDIVLNHVFPTKLLTWSTLFVDATCWITIWIPALRFCTLIEVALLHIGIELCMNVHCLEWLTLLGWSVFLVLPNKSDPDKTKRKVSGLRLLVDNVVIFTLLSGLVTSAAPLEQAVDLMPSSLHAPLISAVSYKDEVEGYMDPTLSRLGLSQGTWDIYSGHASMATNYRWKVIIHFRDKSSVKWRSPNWVKMGWLERKREFRRMLYFENLVDDSASSAWLSLATTIGRSHGRSSEIASIELFNYYEEPKLPRNNLDWYEQAKMPTIMESVVAGGKLVTIIPCQDKSLDCVAQAANGLCTKNKMLMRAKCQKSCGFCNYRYIWEEEESEKQKEEKERMDAIRKFAASEKRAIPVERLRQRQGVQENESSRDTLAATRKQNRLAAEEVTTIPAQTKGLKDRSRALSW